MKAILTTTAVAAFSFTLLPGGTVHAQWAVIDTANLKQTSQSAWTTTLGYVKQGDQWLKQVDQYVLQGRQYQAQVQNLLNLPNQIYGDAMGSVNQTVGLVSSIPGSIPTAPGMPTFNANFQSLPSWNQRPPTLATYRQSTATTSAAELAAYAATAENLIAQGNNMLRDAANLARMTNNAQGATGNLQALQAHAQIASAQVAQLSEMRALLLHLADVTTARNASLANREAAEAAATQQSLRTHAGDYSAVPLNMAMK